jgi:plastocyanin
MSVPDIANSGNADAVRIYGIAVSAVMILAGGVALAASFEVDQVGQRFSRVNLSVVRGDTVQFVNHDDVTHNINVIDEHGTATDKGSQKPGTSIEHLFGKDGKFTVRCAIHPKMKMTIDVK